jgi:hypothetical protein
MELPVQIQNVDIQNSKDKTTNYKPPNVKTSAVIIRRQLQNIDTTKRRITKRLRVQIMDHMLKFFRP